ncbi:MAG TPA: MFS transporter [Myxococcota bacterium]|nr:MFS transporter [Myxococcota bacterium]
MAIAHLAQAAGAMGIEQRPSEPGASLRVFAASLRRDFRFVLAAFAASAVGLVGAIAAPILVQALIEAGFDHQRVGDLAGVELLSLALVAAIATRFVPRVSHRRLAVGGLSLAAAGFATSAVSGDLAAMFVGRALTGAGAGLALSGANAAVASRGDAERIFALIWTLGGLVAAGFAMTLPRMVDAGNYPAGFWVLFALVIACAPCLAWLPSRPDPALFAGQRLRAAKRDGAESSLSTVGAQASERAMVAMALAGILVYAAGDQALWNFAFSIPLEAGIERARAREILAITTLIGVTGSAVGSVLGVRLGRVFPIVCGTLISVVGRSLYIAASAPGALLAGALLWGIGVYFITPFQIGLVAAVDRKGRFAVAAAAALNFGYATGPAVAGRVIQSWGRGWLLALIAISTLASMLLLLPLATRTDRASTANGSAGASA